MPKHTYTKVGQFYVCDDCGSYAFDPADVVHAHNCVPGESAKWKQQYDEAAESEEKADPEMPKPFLSDVAGGERWEKPQAEEGEGGDRFALIGGNIVNLGAWVHGMIADLDPETIRRLSDEDHPY